MNFYLCVKGLQKPLTYQLLLIMKLAIFLTVLTVFQVTASTYAQRVSMQVRNISLDAAMQQVQAQTGFLFFFRGKDVAYTKVSVNIADAEVAKAMDMLLKDLPLSWTLEDETIIISRKTGRITANRLKGPESAVQQSQVRGRVTDEAANPLPGATVTVKGTSSAVTTDEAGNYQITVPNRESTLIFTILGFDPQEIPVGGLSVINAAMKASLSELDEVVVVGYDVQKKVNLTGAVDVVSGEQLANRPAPNVSLLLQGASPNMNINLNSFGGEPGATQTWRIRGVGSISSDTRPLILVDGVESNADYLDPETIESISVFKDASASAVYGSRAAFGVVLITTKKGSKDQPARISYNNNISFSVPIYVPDMENSLIYATAFNQAQANAGLTPTFPDEQIERIKGYMDGTYPYEYNPDKPPYSQWRGRWDGNANYNWTREYYKRYVLQQKHNVSLNGGDRRSQYYINAGFFDQPGAYSWGDDGFKRYNVLANVKSQVADWISFDFSARYARTETDAPLGMVGLERTYTWSQFIDFWPTMPKYNIDGSIANPLILVLEQGGRIVTENHDLWLNIGTEIEPIPGWKTNLYYRYNYRWGSETRNPKPVPVPIPNGTTGNIGEATSGYRSVMNQGQYDKITLFTSYEKRLERHYFKVLAGYERDADFNRGLNGFKTNLITEQVPSIHTATGDFTLDDWMNHWATEGIFGRINYNYDEKYLFEASGRYDGSSRFPSGQRWGLFPSVSAGYNISKENFWTPVSPYVNALKLRASYGSLGNQNVANYLYLPTMGVKYRRNADSYNNPGYLIGDEVPLYALAPAIISDNLTWETITTFDIGVEAGFLKNRLDVMFDWYNRTTSDMLGPSVQLPSVLGTGVPLTNNAKLSTKGFELSVGWKDRLPSGLSYDARLVLGDSKTTILEYRNESGSINGWYKGRVHGDQWGLTTDHIMQNAGEPMPDQSFYYKTWGPGDIVYKDLDGNGIINEGGRTLEDHGDLSVIANTTPRYTYGFTGGLNWKGFDLNMIWQGVGKRAFLPGVDAEYFWGLNVGPSNSGIFKGGRMLDYWRPADETNLLGANTDAYFPKPYFSAERYKNARYQSRYVLNAAYLRLKNLQIGYTVPSPVLNRLSVKSARIYLSAENLLTFSRLPKMYEPETAVASNPLDGGVDLGETYPISQMYSLGVNFVF